MSADHVLCYSIVSYPHVNISRDRGEGGSHHNLYPMTSISKAVIGTVLSIGECI